MKMKCSKSDWESIGKTAGWLSTNTDINDEKMISRMEVVAKRMDEIRKTSDKIIDDLWVKDQNCLYIDIKALKDMLPFTENYYGEELETVYSAGMGNQEFQYELSLYPNCEAWGGTDIKTFEIAKEKLEELRIMYPDYIENIKIDTYQNSITIIFENQLEVRG